jgi:hypothetical protein
VVILCQMTQPFVPNVVTRNQARPVQLHGPVHVVGEYRRVISALTVAKSDLNRLATSVINAAMFLKTPVIYQTFALNAVTHSMKMTRHEIFGEWGVSK